MGIVDSGGGGLSNIGRGGARIGTGILATGFGKLLNGLTGLVVLVEEVVAAAGHGGAGVRTDGAGAADEPSALELRSLPNQTCPGCVLFDTAFAGGGGSAASSSPDPMKTNT